MTFHVPEKFRLRTGAMASNESDGNNGFFFVSLSEEMPIKVIASDKNGWEHISASLPNRYPTPDEMRILKKLFWDGEDCVLQYYRPEQEYVNDQCLHLWRLVNFRMPMPHPMCWNNKGEVK
jgi:hypothetical protein